MEGQEIFAHACKIGLEGVVSKIRDSVYASGRGNNWVKKTCAQRETLTIAGFALDEGKWDGIYLGRRKGNDLMYAGKVDHAHLRREQLVGGLLLVGKSRDQVRRLPGVLAAEPFREVPVRIRHGNVERRITISGRPADADLRRIIDADLRPVKLPETGLAISSMRGHILGVRAGDTVELDLLEGARRTVTMPIVATVEDYFGIPGMLDIDALRKLMREAPVVNSVNLSLDENRKEDFYAAVKSMPTVGGVALQRVSLANFRKTVALLVTTMASIYTGLAAVIAFGVVYNSARISLSERARELASLRVLGFTRGEVLRILLLELAILTLIAQPPGWLMGYGLAWVMKTNLAGELMRVRLVVEHST